MARCKAAITLVFGLALFGCAGTPVAPGQAAASETASEGAAPSEQSAALPGQPLGRFFQDLDRLQAGRINHVRILQLGDSHTAGGVLTERLRGRLQDRFGYAGYGDMPPGHAFNGLRQHEVTVTQTGKWEIENSLVQADAGPYGVSGFVARSGAAGARMAVGPVSADGFDQAEISYLQGPAGGTFEVRVDDHLERTVQTAAQTIGPGRVSIRLPAPGHRLEIVAKGRNVAITAWSIERKARGILLDGHGVVGAQVGLFDRWEPEIVKAEIQALAPSLIILAYGTNEGYQPAFDPDTYAGTFGGVLASLHRYAPQASILVIGAPDAERQDPRCPKKAPKASLCGWVTPPGLAQVRRIQRDLATRDGDYFWDWAHLMDQSGGMNGWVYVEPPLARGDHVHLTTAGYELTADTLYDELMAAYERYRTKSAPRSGS
jgi:lysophospholipase L1-like esterase